MTNDLPSLVAVAPTRLAELSKTVQARIALGRCGSGQPTRASQQFMLDHAFAREAVWSELDIEGLAGRLGPHDLPVLDVKTQVSNRAEYLRRPDYGRRLRQDCLSKLESLRGGDVAIIIADGLSATAVELNAVPVVDALLPLLRAAEFAPCPLIIVTHARVAVGDDIGAALGAKFVVLLIGERPGLSAADSVGAYVTYRPQRGLLDSNRNCISNIREGGLSPSKAAGDIIALLRAMRLQGVSGVHLRSPEIPSIGQPEAAA
jgi:ethanolamine ammonia-lyase small subunit